MDRLEYLDFNLKLEKREQRYAVSVRSPAGEAKGEFALPFSDPELENFILKVGRTRRGVRHIDSPEWQAARAFGGKLFEAIFKNDVRACFVASQNEVQQKRMGLRLKLRIDAPKLTNVPWEYLFDRSLGRFLSLFERTPIVRYIEMREKAQPLAVTPPLSLLVMAASPTDCDRLDVPKEKANLHQALGELEKQGAVHIEWLERATLPALADRLLRGRYHVFHFIGHGGFDESTQDGILVMEDESGRGQRISGERLAVLLGNHPTLKVTVLNACEGARTSRIDPFAGAATTLVRTGGLPAVMAMQFEITDQAAVIFARGFYSALSIGRPVDAAVTQARLAIFATGNDVEWGTPVLYMRSPDGQIFGVERIEKREVPKRRPPKPIGLPEEKPLRRRKPTILPR